MISFYLNLACCFNSYNKV
uniref:Uncharacterized protein n=1 Tax=Arundo donax TaxID=35708 RepID=A0A0A9FQ63_ARUDO